MPKEIRWIFYAALVAVILMQLIGFRQRYRDGEETRRVAEEFRTKLHENEIVAQLRRDNVFSHAAEARVLDCTFNQVAGREGQHWDYLCFLYWGTQPGVQQSAHQMKFGVMVDSSHITRMSPLVPKDAPEPPVDVRASQ
jgi:hypothetical protein